MFNAMSSLIEPANLKEQLKGRQKHEANFNLTMVGWNKLKQPIGKTLEIHSVLFFLWENGTQRQKIHLFHSKLNSNSAKLVFGNLDVLLNNCYKVVGTSITRWRGKLFTVG